MKLFVSQSTLDAKLARILVRFLTTALRLEPGDVLCTSVPANELSPGVKLVGSLKAKLRQADAVVVLITENSLRSPWVLFELGCAMALGRAVFPIAVEPLAPQELPLFLSRLSVVQWEKDSDWYRLATELAVRQRTRQPDHQVRRSRLPSAIWSGVVLASPTAWSSRRVGTPEIERVLSRDHGPILIHDTFFGKLDNPWRLLVERALSRNSTIRLLLLDHRTPMYRRRVSLVLSAAAPKSAHIDQTWLSRMSQVHRSRFAYDFVPDAFVGPFVHAGNEHLFLGLFMPNTPSDSAPLMYSRTDGGLGAAAVEGIRSWLPNRLCHWLDAAPHGSREQARQQSVPRVGRAAAGRNTRRN